MLNRYGLFDMDSVLDSILKEETSDVSQFQTQHGDTIHGIAQDHAEIGKMTGTGYMAGRFKKMGATDSQVSAKASTDKRGDRDAARQTLRAAHEKTGMKQPFHQVFDQKTTGLKGQPHIGFISYLHDGDHKPGKDNTGRIMMQSPGDAQAMVKAGSLHHSNLSFEVSRNQPTTVNYKPAPAPAPQQAPQQPGAAATGGPMGAPMGSPAPAGAPTPPPPLY